MSSSNSPPPLSRRDIAKTVSATKNLRAISRSLAHKVRTHPGLSSAEVANQLASEAIHNVRRAVRAVSAPDLAAIEKNLRRRLYDSLKVLISVGAIARLPATKRLQWRGVAHLHPSFPLRAALTAARARLSQKAAAAARLRAQAAALRVLTRRNASRPAPARARIHLPFVLVRTPPATDITLDTTPDAARVAFELAGAYELLNDAALLDRLFVVPAAPAPAPAPAPALDPLASPARRRVTSRSPFPKYTAARPPPSPATPLRRRRPLSRALLAASPRSGLSGTPAPATPPARPPLHSLFGESPPSVPPRKRARAALFSPSFGAAKDERTRAGAGLGKRLYARRAPAGEEVHVEEPESAELDDEDMVLPESSMAEIAKALFLSPTASPQQAGEQDVL